MRVINIPMEDAKFEQLKTKKGEMSWYDFILTLLNDIPNPTSVITRKLEPSPTVYRVTNDTVINDNKTIPIEQYEPGDPNAKIEAPTTWKNKKER